MRIELVLSARMVCFATSIFPVMFLADSSPFLLLTESDLGFGSIMEALGWLICEIIEFYEYTCYVDWFSFITTDFEVFFLLFICLGCYWGCFRREFRKVFVNTIYYSDVSFVIVHSLDRISPRSFSRACRVFSWWMKDSSTYVPSRLEFRYYNAL